MRRRVSAPKGVSAELANSSAKTRSRRSGALFDSGSSIYLSSGIHYASAGSADSFSLWKGETVANLSFKEGEVTDNFSFRKGEIMKNLSLEKGELTHYFSFSEGEISDVTCSDKRNWCLETA